MIKLILSRDNIAQEVDHLRKWKAALEKYAPETYKQLIGAARNVGKLK